MFKIVTIVALIATTFIGCATQQEVFVKHPTDIMVTSATPATAFTSLGTISVSKTEMTFATSGVQMINAEKGNLTAVNDSLVGELETYLAKELAAKAKQKGGNAVINVKYGIQITPIFLPFYGPLAIKLVGATGEVVTIK